MLGLTEVRFDSRSTSHVTYPSATNCRLRNFFGVAQQRGKDNEGAVADATVALDDKEEENKKDKKEILKWRSNIEIILIARA